MHDWVKHCLYPCYCSKVLIISQLYYVILHGRKKPLIVYLSVFVQFFCSKRRYNVITLYIHSTWIRIRSFFARKKNLSNPSLQSRIRIFKIRLKNESNFATIKISDLIWISGLGTYLIWVAQNSMCVELIRHLFTSSAALKFIFSQK